MSKSASNGGNAAAMDVDNGSAAQEEYEYDEEEYYVVANLPPGTLQRAQEAAAENGQPGPKYAIIGMETDRPLLEIEGTIYQGLKDELLGTSILLEVEANEESEKTSASLVAKTSQAVRFLPVKLRRK